MNHNSVAGNENNHTAAHVHRDDVGAKLGMWLFLFTEVLLFGGMFLAYAVYRYQYPDQFRIAAMELNTGIGTLNTVILLTSSLTVALSIAAIQKKNKFLSILMLSLTVVFALMFMVNKYFEWMTKIDHGIFPGSEELLGRPNGQILFFGLYYVMTGLHGLHVFIGVIVLLFMLYFLIKNDITPDNYTKLENAGLYWHLVDLIWIFLFPLFYLIQ
ncbi:MAG: cytochrome c oxidase subunit 3 family protein [Melioribacter sp.]|jgi:cytochrome c oxidase subunit 3|uniref:cytochrome c oxidase subunit 3 family protein n=1 Tax=Melioribacter sp. TaxID=2052167 RepID=UPI003BCFB3D2